MTAEFEYAGNSLEVFDYKYLEEEAYRGNPYNSSFKIKVVSDGFSGVAECEYDRREWDNFIVQLELLNDFKLNEVVFKDICYGSTISFIMDAVGHLIVSGMIYGSGMSQSLKFEFSADQTVLAQFICDLREL